MNSELVHRELPSPNWDERALPISMVVLHYTEMEREAALRRLTDPEAQVSAHYFISEAGEVVRLVPEDKRAWHAGRSFWRGHKDVNSASIGIELDHPGHGLGRELLRFFHRGRLKLPVVNAVAEEGLPPAMTDEVAEGLDVGEAAEEHLLVVAGQDPYRTATLQIARELDDAPAVVTAVHEIAQQHDQRFRWRPGSVVGFDRGHERFEQVEPSVNVADRIDSLPVGNRR